MSDLKPCPFCGCKVGIVISSYFDERFFHVWHDGEKCAFAEPIVIDGVATLEEAKEAWNSRVNDRR